MKRRESDISAFVNDGRRKITSAKSHFKPVYDRMRECMDFAYYNAPPRWCESGRYVVPVLRRQLKQTTAGLYARNPVATAERRRKIDSVFWNGDLSTLEQSMQVFLAAASGQPIDPEIAAKAQEIIAEAEATKNKFALRDRFAKTLEILFDYYIRENDPDFKRQMKALIYRVKVCSVGYLKLDFQRLMKPRAAMQAKIEDDTTQLAEIDRLAKSDDRSKAEDTQLRLFDENPENDKPTILREGPVFDFPKSDKIIIDPQCVALDGFVGANWIAHELDLTPNEIERIYKVDIAKSAGNEQHIEEERKLFGESSFHDRKICVWEVEDKTTQQVFTICDKHDGFLREPSEPRVKLERFWTVFPLVFDPNEHPDHLYPLSFVYLMQDTQNEYNVARQGLKDHRRANKPMYGVKKGALNNDEMDLLRDHEANEVIEVQSLGRNEKLHDVVSPFQPYTIDPNQYAVHHVMDDVQRAGGMQEANIGGTSKATATESTIAESSRETGQSSEIDDLNDFLSGVAKGLGELMLGELSIETVKEIAGEGAVWPALSENDIFKGVILQVRAGSSGRPNQASTLAKFERAMPFVAQLPNVNPRPIAERYAEALDIDPEELVIEGLPSINMANGGKLPTSSPAPTAQGPQGQNNAPRPVEAPQSAQNQLRMPEIAPGETVSS